MEKFSCEPSLTGKTGVTMKILNKYLQFELKLEDYLTGVPNKKTFKDIIILKAQNIVFRELVNIPLNQALQAA